MPVSSKPITEFELSSKSQFEPITSAVEYLFKNQSKLGSIIGELANKCNYFFHQAQKSKEPLFRGSNSENSSCPTSRTTKSGNDNQPSDNFISNFSSLLAQIELISEETNIKFQQYEDFLKGAQNNDMLILNNSITQRSEPKHLKKELFQNSAKKAPNFISEYLQAPSEYVTNGAQPTQNLNNVSATEDPDDILKELAEKIVAQEIDKAPIQVISVERKRQIPKGPEFDSGALKLTCSGLNSGEASRRNSQKNIELPISPQNTRKKRPILQLNLATRSHKNLFESIAEKTENYLARNLKCGAEISNTCRDTVTNAVKLKILEANKNKRADLDSVISKIHDESKLLKGSQTTRETTFEKAKQFHCFNLDETNANLRNLTSGTAVSPSNMEKVKIFSNITTSSGQKFEYSIQKLAIKPENNVLPKKELSESSVKCSEEPSQLSNASRQSKTQDQEIQKIGLQNIAMYEKLDIKSIMKMQYGTESAIHKADHGKILQRKYLISAKWWRSWKEFVNFDAKEAADEAKPPIFDAQIYRRPGPITNSDLLNEDTFRDPKALEFDLDLKQNLLEHHDFEAVSKQVFDLLHDWYGCDYEIYRVLKPDPFHDNKLFLDLYPKTKYKRNQFAKSTTPVRSKAEVVYPLTGRKKQ